MLCAAIQATTRWEHTIDEYKNQTTWLGIEIAQKVLPPYLTASFLKIFVSVVMPKKEGIENETHNLLAS